MPEKICLSLDCAAGDITCVTSLPRDIHAAYPGRFEISVATNCKSLWHHNPHVTTVHDFLRPVIGARRLVLKHQHWIHKSNNGERVHFVNAFHNVFTELTGLQLPCTQPKGDLYLEPWQYKTPPISGRYWLAMCGGKRDATVKIWSPAYWQELVNILRDRGIRIVQSGAAGRQDIHFHLENTLDLVGKANLRELMWKLYHADGVICPITCTMHMAAVFDKPCVVIAGGRESWWWEAYVNVQNVQQWGKFCAPVRVPHRYLHTQGLLNCCKQRGCWKNKVTPAEMSKSKQAAVCRNPVQDSIGYPFPQCLQMITPIHVANAVTSYYSDGTLPPISQNYEIVLPQCDVATLPTVPMSEFVPTPAAEIRQIYGFSGDKAPKKAPVDAIFDDPIIGGKFAICILMYGDYFDMQKQCLDSILATVPAHRRTIRVVANTVGDRTLAYLRNHAAAGAVKLTVNDENKKKYPAMRQLFWNPDDPIEEKWIIWFDDDSIANRDPAWCQKLAKEIISQYKAKIRMWGRLWMCILKKSQLEWIKSRPWFTGREFVLRNGQPNPRGTCIKYASGGFWALETATMRAAGIPDETLGHNGGDYMIGAQVWQAGFETGMCNKNKQLVNSSAHARRGLHEIHTGLPGWQPGGASAPA